MVGHLYPRQALRIDGVALAHLGPGETATFSAREDTELLHFGLPNLAGLRRPVHDAAPAEAAEQTAA